MAKLIYCATPSRLVKKIKEIMDFVNERGNAPLHPFQAFPYERFEGNPNVGRKKTIEWCLKLMEMCDEFWLFGISEGTLQELNYALKIKKPAKTFLEFDEDWKKFYEELGDNFSDPLKKIERS